MDSYYPAIDGVVLVIDNLCKELSKFNFIDKSRHENFLKWNSKNKIMVLKDELVKSINFLCPSCNAIYPNIKTRIVYIKEFYRLTVLKKIKIEFIISKPLI